jgi:hypothetical protein
VAALEQARAQAAADEAAGAGEQDLHAWWNELCQQTLNRMAKRIP